MPTNNKSNTPLTWGSMSMFPDTEAKTKLLKLSLQFCFSTIRPIQQSWCSRPPKWTFNSHSVLPMEVIWTTSVCVWCMGCAAVHHMYVHNVLTTNLTHLAIFVFSKTLPVLTLCSCDRASWVKREERKPTRCNNIDDLFPIVDVDYWHCLNMFRASLCPSSGERHLLLHVECIFCNKKDNTANIRVLSCYRKYTLHFSWRWA